MRRSDLVSDCGACRALCCIATSFDASEDFGFDKAAGVRCRHLTPSCACRIHDDLVERGFLGCAAYDCYGAGQRATRAFAAESERTQNQAFLVLRSVHELVWLLTEAAKLCPRSEAELSENLRKQIRALDAIAGSEASVLVKLDLGPHEERARALLRGVGDALGGRLSWTKEGARGPGEAFVEPARLRRDRRPG